MIELTKFNDLNNVYNGKTKRDIFDSTIWSLRRDQDNLPIDTQIFFTLETLKKLTKSTTALIKELINDKVIIRDPNNSDQFIINSTKVYCLSCERDQHIKSKTERSYDSRDLSFYEYDIRSHLRINHYYEKIRSINEPDKFISPITDKVINETITYKKPIFETHKHNFEIINIDNSRLDEITIKVKCQNCKAELSINENIATCTKRIDQN